MTTLKGILMRKTSGYLLSTMLLALLVEPALAHDQKFPLEGRSARLNTKRGPDRHRFRFTTLRQDLIVPAHDPATTTSSVLVRALFASGSHSTGLITLDRKVRQGTPPSPTS